MHVSGFTCSCIHCSCIHCHGNTHVHAAPVQVKEELDEMCGKNTLSPNVVVAMFLVREGASISIKNKRGFTPLQARAPDVVELIVNYAVQHIKWGFSYVPVVRCRIATYLCALTALLSMVNFDKLKAPSLTSLPGLPKGHRYSRFERSIAYVGNHYNSSLLALLFVHLFSLCLCSLPAYMCILTIPTCHRGHQESPAQS